MKEMPKEMSRRRKVNRIDYCQYLLSSQTNYTLTYVAKYKEGISHDSYNRYLASEKLSPRMLWEHAKHQVVLSENSFIVYDDTVLDKSYAKAIDLARYQYSGNSQEVINGIGVVNAIYVNPETEQFWVIDYRIYAPEQDGKSKLDHLFDMQRNIHYQKQLPYKGVLMDSWYATHKVMLTIDALGKLFYCPIKANRLVSETEQDYHHIPTSKLSWDQTSLAQGKTVHLNKFPNDFHVQLYRITASTCRTDFIVTNDKSQLTAEAIQNVYNIRWCVEEFHREDKQLTGVAKCQCRKQRIQRNHITCAYLVWLKLKSVAHHAAKTIYQIKDNLLEQYMINELRQPQVKFDFA